MNLTNENKQEILKKGQTTDFWEIIVISFKDSIEHLQEQIDSDDLKDLPAEQYKLECELIKAKKQYLKNLMKLPENLINWLENPNKGKVDNFDPYETEKEQ